HRRRRWNKPPPRRARSRGRRFVWLESTRGKLLARRVSSCADSAPSDEQQECREAPKAARWSRAAATTFDHFPLACRRASCAAIGTAGSPVTCRRTRLAGSASLFCTRGACARRRLRLAIARVIGKAVGVGGDDEIGVELEIVEPDAIGH